MELAQVKIKNQELFLENALVGVQKPGIMPRVQKMQQNFELQYSLLEFNLSKFRTSY